MLKIIDFLSSIATFIKNVGGLLLSIVKGLGTFGSVIYHVMTSLPRYAALMPLGLGITFGLLVALAIVFRILGREG